MYTYIYIYVCSCVHLFICSNSYISFLKSTVPWSIIIDLYYVLFTLLSSKLSCLTLSDTSNLV